MGAGLEPLRVFTVPRSELHAQATAWAFFYKDLLMCDDATLRRILTETQCVACVGFSAKPERPSHYVSAFLHERGVRVIPVNPGLAGQTFLRETVFAKLSDIPHSIPVQMIDVFRRNEELPGVVDEAISALPHLETVWMQLGIRNEVAADTARQAGLTVVQDRCPKIEVPRLGL